MSLFNVFKSTVDKESKNQHNNVGAFDVNSNNGYGFNQNIQQINNSTPQFNSAFNNELANYQNGLVNQKNMTDGYYLPRNNTLREKEVDTYNKQFNASQQYVNINQMTPQSNYQNANIQNLNYEPYNYYQPRQDVYGGQIPPRPVEENYNFYNNEASTLQKNDYNPNNYAQNVPFQNRYVQDDIYHNQLQPNLIYGAQPQFQSNFPEQIRYDSQHYAANNMNYGYKEFTNNRQFYNQNNQYGYNQNYNNNMQPSNNYNQYNDLSYKARMKKANIIPTAIGREIRSEKLRIFALFLLGTIGIIVTSFMLAIYYKTIGVKDSKWLGFNYEKVMYPFFSIFFLIISICFFGISTSDYTLLHSNVKKYEQGLLYGIEKVPYFITRNYRSLLSRSIYINWIAFSTYICGSISLGILYGFQAMHDSDKPLHFFFWEIGKVTKSFSSDITVNIIVLLVMLSAHILNIITSRSRKNNIISYYGYEIIPQQEITKIKKRANRRCLIIFCVTMALILFVIVIPWLIFRKKKGLSLKPWAAK